MLEVEKTKIEGKEPKRKHKNERHTHSHSQTIYNNIKLEAIIIFLNT